MQISTLNVNLLNIIFANKKKKIRKSKMLFYSNLLHPPHLLYKSVLIVIELYLLPTYMWILEFLFNRRVILINGMTLEFIYHRSGKPVEIRDYYQKSSNWLNLYVALLRQYSIRLKIF